ncbi:hypothetical protein [Aerosakkonema funiforme]|nr:hypothetical protein [Aerosakkonema funiforme]
MHDSRGIFEREGGLAFFAVPRIGLETRLRQTFHQAGKKFY